MSRILVILNILMILAIDCLFWASSVLMGVLSLLGIMGWFIAYKYSVEVVVSKRDYWAHPLLKVTKKKFKFANLTMLTVWFVTILIGDLAGFAPVVEFINWLR